ncbi:related to C2H2-type zinc finger protein [Ustilago trichophora]|uniref:Related to C2H2-type zinc finger protein n=1 Tax=Ustilago trichophora TaxID=86804 RepID=A0A5C3E4S4_9BASI|nr:related to C2H2-type zinc finger protein [Ustilago trichophora]
MGTPDASSGGVQDLGHNSLGLLGSISPEVHPTTSVAMSHSHSMPAFGLHVSGLPQPSYGARRGSVSSAASSSCVSLEQASEHSTATGSYSPRSFTPSESPMNLPGSLSSLSGLALGTPETPGHAELPSYADHNTFQPEQHNALLALSHGQDEFSLEMPPPSHIRRRAAQSFDVAMLSTHHHEPNLFAHSQRINESDGSEETTPMPSSTGTFAGHSVVNLSEGFRAAQMPVTPQSASSRASLGPGPCTFTPGHSYSPGSTPEHSIRGDLSHPSSPFYPPSAIALRRLTSADSVRSDSYAPHEIGTPGKDAPPLLSLSDLNHMPKHEPSFQPNLAFRDHFQSPSSFQPHRASLPDMSSAGMSSSVMARVASAPTSSPMPHLSRSSTSSEASSFASFPSTPSSSIASGDGRRPSFMYPSTPTNDLMSPGFDPYYSAPQMSGHRSNSMISLGSPIHDGSFTSTLDGRSRSVSGSVTRTTPRGRARNAGPPPLIVSSADKLHVCHCGKRFKRMEHLKRHNRTHTQERPHKCPVETCGKFFGRSDNLAQHLKTHFRPAGLVGRSSELLSLTAGSDKYKNSEPRHDPYAAAAAAAAAAAQAAVSVNGKRGSISQACLGGPIALNKPMPPRQALAPAGGLSANSSPTMQESGMQLSAAHFA